MGEFGPKTLEVLNTIGEIRNAFAHSAKSIDFSFQPVITLCESIKISTLLAEDDRPLDPKSIFREAVAQIIASLTVTIRTVGESPSLIFSRVKLP